MNHKTIAPKIENPKNSNRKLRVAILGARGIGKIHARTFHKLGAEVCSILSSTESTGTETAQELKSLFNINAKPFTDLNQLLKISSPDAVSICTPTELHFGQILEIFKKGGPVFCEKPLFWNSELSYEEFSRKLNILSNHPNRALFVNTSNASYINSINKRLPKSDLINFFDLKFHTHGPLRNKDIAYDLLPHGLSMLIELFGKREITQFNKQVSENNYKCNFYYGKCLVEFDFIESNDVEKKLLFTVNNTSYLRIQKGNLSEYKVFIKDCRLGDIIPVVDPFEVYISRFLEFCRASQIKRKDAFEESSYNMELMADILLKN